MENLLSSIELHPSLREEKIDLLQGYTRISDHPNLPAWWSATGNALYVPKHMASATVPHIASHPGLPLPVRCCLVTSGRSDYAVTLWGRQSLLYIAPDAHLNGSLLQLGDGSIFIGPQTGVIARLTLNCRNGGRIHLKKDILVAGDVRIMTDDCHAILDVESGKRVNPFGGKVVIGEHVWIGQESLILGDTLVGDHMIIGARSIVKGAFAGPNQIIAGAPARPIRNGVTWDRRDLPPV